MRARRLLVVSAVSVMGLGLMSAVIAQGAGQAMAAPGKPAAAPGPAIPGRALAPAAARPAAQGIGVTVTKTANPDPYVPGEPLTFTVSLVTTCVGGRCPVDVPTVLRVLVNDPLPAQLSGTKFTWTCAASAGSSCAASG